jgi:O-acetylhomoserine/O-acetylserine sulfhydrylase-like pyridoxal-dependent enzyme
LEQFPEFTEPTAGYHGLSRSAGNAAFIAKLELK